MRRLPRLFRHLVTGPVRRARCFGRDVLDAVERAVGESERTHRAELVVAIEGGMPASVVLRGTTVRARAIEIFSRTRTWDTAENNGVLLYVSVADRAFELVADRGVAGGTWHREACAVVEACFREGRFREGLEEGIRSVTAHLAGTFPRTGEGVDELGDRPRTI